MATIFKINVSDGRGGLRCLCLRTEVKMIHKISNISDDAKYWFIASILSLTVFAFVITTPGDKNIAYSNNARLYMASSNYILAARNESGDSLRSQEYSLAEGTSNGDGFDFQTDER
jgi:hypothetical protein